jgi:magnesium chelatase family protein
VSGPLLDRIDIHIEVHAVKFRDMVSTDLVESSATIRERVLLARQRQAARFGKEVGFFSNAGMRKREIRTYCNLEPSGEEMLKTAITRLGLSARAYDKVLKVARTVADLSGDDRILLPHLSEAIQYRSLDRHLGL